MEEAQGRSSYPDPVRGPGFAVLAEQSLQLAYCEPMG